MAMGARQEWGEAQRVPDKGQSVPDTSTFPMLAPGVD